MNKSKNIDVHSLWLDKLANQVNAGGLDVRCALSLAFYSGELIGGKEDFPVEKEKILEK
jgi:hypothetical protein